MAPGRRRGGKGSGAPKTELSLGDLVLAKVKGFPAWPAKISRPEDWDRAPDPKKYFVQFFGTEEIAFVAPADIQAFTIEVKNKLSVRCQGKTIKHFAQAVKEICAEFELLQGKNSVGPREDDNGQDLGKASLAAEGLVADAIKANLTNPIGSDGANQLSEFKGCGLECCSLRQEETGSQDIKPRNSSGENGVTSLNISSKKGSKFSTNGINTVKEELVSTSNPCRQSLRSTEEGCSPLLSSDHSDNADDANKDVTNGHRPRLASVSKRRPDGSFEMHTTSGSSDPSLLPSDNLGRNLDCSASTQPSGSDVRKTFASGAKESSQNVLLLGLDTDNGKRPKRLLKDEKNFEVAEKCQVDGKDRHEEEKCELYSKKQGRGKQTSETNEHSHPSKRSKHANMADDATKVLLQKSRKIDSQSHDKSENVEVKRNVLRGKAENCSGSRPLTTTSDSTLGGDEDVLPPTKRCRRALEAMSGSSTLMSEYRIGSSGHKNDMSRRRAVRICDDDEEEDPKTPIHGASGKKVTIPLHVQASIKKADNDPLAKRDSVSVDDSSLKKVMISRDRSIESCSPDPQQTEVKQHGNTEASHASHSPEKFDTEKLSSKDAKPVPLSPKRSPIASTKSVPNIQKANKHIGKIPGSNTQRKAVSVSKSTGGTDNSSLPANQLPSDSSKFEFSVERNKDPNLLARNLMDIDFLPGERFQTGKNDKLNSIDQTTSDPATSMRHLIAAAQEKKRQAHLRNFNVNSNSYVASRTDLQAMSPNPAFAAQPSASSNMPLDAQGFVLHAFTASPPDTHPISSFNQQDNDELEERRVSSGRHAARGSLSGGTEAAVARDSFEGMIETLSRTKESIGRATRLAIDCAKYGIANEVVELLIRKLENEPSCHRKVDLFFLVDSITQCSHSHKGIAGASYIPVVQAALPRLLGAAAPSGSGARENRRQCLKVLRLWLERKILPESLLRRYMDDIGAMNDDSSSGFPLRRPSRAERAIDDPIREMEGMLVDEYGSNATFQLPGFFSPHAFHEDNEEDDFPSSSKEVLDVSPSEHTPISGDSEIHPIASTERRHHILEAVDGELEMEDVSEHQKDERTSLNGDAFGIASSHIDSIRISGLASVQLPPISEGSPPLPPDSPPETPPLPSSQPPSPPAPAPPPPPTSPSPPPPPPPPALQPHLILPLPVGPTMLPPPPPLAPQPSVVSQHMQSLPSSIFPSSHLAFQPAPVAQEIAGNTSGNPHPQLAASAPHGPPADASGRNEVFSQQAPCFVPVGVASSREPSGYNSSRPLEYGHSDTYINPQNSLSNQQFQPSNTPLTQRPLPPNPPSQNASSHFSYPANAIRQQPAAPVQHHPQHAYPPPYSVPNFADGPRQFLHDERWRMPPNEFNADHQRGMWMPGVRSCSGPAYVKDGYFIAPPERPSAGTAGFRPPATKQLPAGSSVPGHGISHMIPSRPDVPAVSWRPA